MICRICGHLRVERTAEFTRALVNEWLAACNGPQTRASSGDVH